MKKLKFYLTCTLTVGLLLNIAPRTMADIIVVEGRLTDEQGTTVNASDETEDTKSSVGLILPRIILVPVIPPAHNNDEKVDDATPPASPASPDACDDDELNAELCEMDEEPEGYTCEDIGHGMELCEKNDDDAEEDVEENEETGCSASGQMNPSTFLLGLLLFGLWALRRNRMVRS